MAAFSEMDEVFRALADPSRRRLLDRLNARGGQTLRELCAGLDMARQSVSKHLAILEAANLVTTVRRGREKLHYLNAVPISEIGERWISHYERERVHVLADLKRALEEEAMDKPSFVYTTYIETTPERLWQALTDPAFTKRYWNATFDTDWQAGSPMTWHQLGTTIADPGSIIAAIIGAQTAMNDTSDPRSVATPMSIPSIWRTARIQDAAARPTVAGSAAAVATVERLISSRRAGRWAVPRDLPAASRRSRAGS